ncbi:MAG: protein translocase subunit SecF [Nanoarchaeota archaeon]|nr:protein translocase subunit SecF [Nanoarchaeota archaeon]
MEQEQIKNKNWHDKYYKILLVIPAILLLISLISLFIFYQKTGDIINRDVSLKGGTSITVFSQTNLDELKVFLSEKFQDFNVREISNLKTGQQEAFIVEVSDEPENVKKVLEDYLGFNLNEKNSTIEFTGSSMGQGFYKQLRTAIIIAFILMSLVVFFIFRTFVPSLAVILSALADICMSLALVNFLGIKLSAAGIIAFLMLIGYSVDSDILLTTRILKRKENSLNSRIFEAFKTGLTMTLTSLVAVSISLIIVISFSNTLSQIFTILVIGLSFDLINTWIANLGILKWYAEKRGIE